MDLITLVLWLIIIGFLLWLFNKFGAQYVDAKLVTIINIVVVIAVVLWILSLFIGGLPSIHVGK